ncbi:BREX-2 system adenine-specific DNA-methyltransferase PglX [Nonomuraea ferruginea]|uniref:site-specific DNA-methyltransferase (adenine-specific) n=1 Tax=Nonomuraea ferruginea TaxID=46174 RepID=A0ABT4T0X7_9ACTN|nr:BREX-2 system adenine-specific DNA-methyltransferase PglX [Nonomuraea ferruginea]MDA0642785.1 BREX-2 system adenine-specific DNA-methyltransferase PglX [Nonomuraea ferruginea]
MIDRKALLEHLKQQVKAVEADLAKQVKALPETGARLRAEYDQARKLGRTAATWTSWLDERVTQVAVAWVLGTVFVRFCEDNMLISEPYLTAPDDERRDLAHARYEAYVEEDPDPTYRGWLERAFAELGEGQAGRLLFDRVHNPLFQIPLSHDGARTLVEFWRERDGTGTLIHNFADPLSEDGTEGWDTRFLGDLYQDLSEAARKTYALLQTPEFVEEFILDRTMDPAVREFGFEELKMIDPTCGSGHFVLGAFRRLVRLWAERRPDVERHERVRAAMDSVHGVDVNPFAVAIARFRLLVAAMAAAGTRTLTEAAKYDWPMHLAIGDSLIKERQLELTLGDEVPRDPLAEFTYAVEDVHEHPGILESGRYHVVVGNPPYITVKDKKLNELYRELYNACAGTYALSVPFAQRFFELAKRGDTDRRGYGIVGQITSNSFMKREFGVKLIEEFLAHKVELTEVIDTSGAYIPGHGTPTVILIGTRRSGKERSETVRTIRGIQGEPSAPERGEDGLVWNAIVQQIDDPEPSNPWVSVENLGRDRYFGKHPWILTDGGREIVEQLSRVATGQLGLVSEAIGRTTHTGLDDAFYMPEFSAKTRGIGASCTLVVLGDGVRDFEIQSSVVTFFPYDKAGEVRKMGQRDIRFLWPNRTPLQQRVDFGQTPEQRGMGWFEHSMFFPKRYRTPLSISFAEVATHNHFALDRGEKVFKQTAPVIKLRASAKEDDYLRLLGLLNSSTGALWLKMNCHNKGGSGMGRGFQDQEWENRYQFNGANVGDFPLPAGYADELSMTLDKLAQNLSTSSPAAIASEQTPTSFALREARVKWHSIRAQMIALQEELDWQVYSLYNLHPEDLRTPNDADIPELALGERAFEIVLARKVAKGEASDEWFKRHGSMPITEIPAHWPEPYKQVVQKRIDAIESSRAIGMIERAEYKRRWATEGWDPLQEKALRSWLLDRIEKREHWYDQNGQPAIVTLARLTDALSRDEDFVSVAGIYAPRRELVAVVADLMADEHVPFLAALRYEPSGLKKRADWEHVWDLQRQEDAAPDESAKRKIRDSIPVPPKYTSADFVKPSYWRARGKLDVPKERFISYPSTTSGLPELYGWAGWDHREQAQALATYFTNQPLTSEEIAPFLAGLLELQPWLYQWHHEFDALYSGSPADFFAGYRQQIQGEHGLTDDDLRNWRPAAPARGRRTAKK